MRHHKDFITAFVDSYSTGHKTFLTWSCISAIASAMGRKSFFVDGELHTYPNLYIMLVGASGSGKTVSCMRAMDILKGTERVYMLPSDLSANGLFSHLLKASKEPYNAITVDKLVRATATATLYSPEAETFIGASKQRAIMTSSLTALFDTHGPISEYSKTGLATGAIKLHNHCINLLTCTTPIMLNHHLTPIDLANGFAARLLIINDYNFYKQAEIGKNNTADAIISADAKNKLIDDLKDISLMKGRFSIDIGSIHTLNMAVRKINWWLENHWNNPYSGYFTRKKMYIIKVAMILSASESSNRLIAPHHIDKAIKLLSDLESNSQEAFRRISDTSLSELTMEVWSFIRFYDDSKRKLTRAMIFNKFLKGKSKHSQELVNVLNSLESAGRIKQYRSSANHMIVEKISNMPLYPSTSIPEDI